MRRRLALASLLALWLIVLPLAGCSKGGKGDPRQPPPPIVSVAQVSESELLDYEDFTGRTAAIKTVEVKPRATGYLEEVLFRDGDFVKEGQVLYRIDDRTYKAEVARLKAEIVRIEASLANYTSQLNNARRMRVGDAISREEYDKIAANKSEAAATLEAAKASARRAELSLGFTEVKALISGVIAKSNLTRGNLVTQDQTLLTTIVSYDPIWAYFDVDERTVLRFKEMVRQKKFPSYREADVPVYIGTQTEKGFPHKGRIDYVDPAINPSTGTLSVRGVFNNVEVDWPPGAFKKITWGGLEDDAPPPVYLLTPGLFVRVRLPIGTQPKTVIQITDRAIGSIQGQKFVYVVSAENKVEERTVETGSLRDGMRVIESGLRPGDWVVVEGLQRLRPGVVVEPNKVKMPGPDGAGNAQPRRN